MPDNRLLSLLGAYRRRFRAVGMSRAVLVASAAAGVVLGVATLFAVSVPVARTLAVVVFIIAASTVSWWAWRRWTPARVASEVESRYRSLDNLVVTAEEIASGRGKVPHPAIADELFTAAVGRLELTPAASVQPLAREVSMAVLSVVAIVTGLVALPASHALTTSGSTAAPTAQQQSLTPGDLRVVVTPPAYARRSTIESINPTSIVALEGSRVRLEVIRPNGDVSLYELDGRETRFASDSNVASVEVLATTTRPLVVRQSDATGVTSDRLVHLRVQNDERPAVAIRQPAKDLVFPEGRGDVSLEIEARDDVGLASLVLRYTRVSGSGETFTFEEGEWPIDIARQGVGDWKASGVLSLAALKLQDGDTLVYRAIARDARPGADPSASDTFLIEIGRLAGVASTGFALPEERDRQAISQQMLIIKTERLHADRGKVAEEAFAEQARMLAVEQRMVKAEFVFLTGGEVEDEVEEATHAHELAEGRLENSGQAELLAAIREMSRAEARLNAADTAQALEFERAALKALQRAFDRRRYLLRTLPERTRIDVSRRLTGELETARSSTQQAEAIPADPVVQNARAILHDLSTTIDAASATVLASRVLALDAGSEALQAAALRISTAGDDEARAAAVKNAQHEIVTFLQGRMATQAATPLQNDVLRGRLVQELSGRGTP